MARRADRGRARRRTRRAGRGRTARAQRASPICHGTGSGSCTCARSHKRACWSVTSRRARVALRSARRRSPIVMRSPSRRCRSGRSRCGWGCSPTLLERWDDAAEHFRTAMERCDAMGARAIRAMVLIEHARMLLARRDAGDDGSAPTGCSQDAIAICDELGMPGIRERALTLAPSGVAAATSLEVTQRVAASRRAVLDDPLRPRDGAAPGPQGPAPPPHLLAAPGRELHVLELVRAESGAPVDRTHRRCRRDPRRG